MGRGWTSFYKDSLPGVATGSKIYRINTLCIVGSQALGEKVHVGLAMEHGATAGEIRGALLLSAGVAGLSASVQSLHWAEEVLARR